MTTLLSTVYKYALMHTLHIQTHTRDTHAHTHTHTDTHTLYTTHLLQLCMIFLELLDVYLVLCNLPMEKSH